MTGVPHIFDYAVVGGGPAGSMAAYSVAGRGRSVVLFDWNSRREKSCGGGVPNSGMREFGHLLGGVPRNEVRSIRLVSPRGHRVEIELHEPIAIFARAEFDSALVRRAEQRGARRLPLRVVDYERVDGGFALHAHGEDASAHDAKHIVRARFLVAADGACGVIRGKLLDEQGIPAVDKAQFSRSLNTYPPSSTPLEVLEIAYVEGRDGYAWTFPRKDHLSVGICEQSLAGGTSSLKTDLCELVEHDSLTGDAQLAGVGSPIPSLRDPSRSPVPAEGTGFALVGDAVGAVDPITREGIHHAMLTGFKIGELDPLEHPGEYSRWYEGEILPELQAAARWAPRFFQPRFLDLMVRALAASERMRAVFRDLVSGRQSYSALRRRLVLNLPVSLGSYLAHRVARVMRRVGR